MLFIIARQRNSALAFLVFITPCNKSTNKACPLI
jgi:hypothetical protein